MIRRMIGLVGLLAVLAGSMGLASAQESSAANPATSTTVDEDGGLPQFDPTPGSPLGIPESITPTTTAEEADAPGDVSASTAEQVTILNPISGGTLSSSPGENPPHHTFIGDWAADIQLGGAQPVYARFGNAALRI